MMRNFLGLMIALLLAVSSSAQTDYSNKFSNGKQLFLEGKYSLSMQVLKEVIGARESSYAPYASFYYALSAYHQKEDYIAKSMFLQILDRYPKWDQNDEVHFWLATMYFEEGDYDRAIEECRLIRDKQEVRDQKMHFLGMIEEEEVLRELYAEFPEDAEVGECLANSIGKKPFIQQDRATLEELVQKFDLDGNRYDVASVSGSRMKDSYNVAVMFPFMSDELNPQSNRSKPPLVVDLFEGIKIAVNDLSNEGIQINLKAFDTKRDSTETARILSEESFGNTDLIVGPLLSTTSKLVNFYSFNKKINMVNPLSGNSEVIGNNPYSFLFMPSRETLGQKSAEFVSQSIDNKYSVVYSSPRDTAMARSFIRGIEQDSFRIIIREIVPDSLYRQIVERLNEREDDEDETLIISEDSIGHVFLASSSELVVSNVISAVELRLDKIPLITGDDILRLRSISLPQLERLGTILINTTYVDPYKEAVIQFDERFIREYGRTPSNYVYIGYELMMFYGRRLNEGGSLFQQKLNEAPRIYPGILMNGFDYYQANDNRQVEFIQLKDDRFEKITPKSFREAREEDEN